MKKYHIRENETNFIWDGYINCELGNAIS